MISLRERLHEQVCEQPSEKLHALTRAFIDQLCKHLDEQLCGHLHEQLTEQHMQQILERLFKQLLEQLYGKSCRYYTSIQMRKQSRELTLDFAAHPHEPSGI